MADYLKEAIAIIAALVGVGTLLGNATRAWLQARRATKISIRGKDKEVLINANGLTSEQLKELVAAFKASSKK